jgi:antitoxin component YwqK of YwqJK toxin-antitoxin module
MIASLLISFPSIIYGKQQENCIEKDTNKNDKIDQIACFDPNNQIQLLKIDSNHDGHFDRFQYYQEKKVERLEIDRDEDDHIDTRLYFKNEKRVRQEKIKKDNLLYQLLLFDENEQPARMKKDSSLSGKFDTFYEFQDGMIQTVTKDPDENGVMNEWTTFHNNKPVEKKT